MFAAAFWAPRYWAGDYFSHEGADFADFVPIHVFYVQNRPTSFTVERRQ